VRRIGCSEKLANAIGQDKALLSPARFVRKFKTKSCILAATGLFRLPQSTAFFFSDKLFASFLKRFRNFRTDADMRCKCVPE
jgi:hypothetical protein